MIPKYSHDKYIKINSKITIVFKQQIIIYRTLKTLYSSSKKLQKKIFTSKTST